MKKLMENDTNISIFENISECEVYCDYTEEKWYEVIFAFIAPRTQEWVLIGLFIIVFIFGIGGNFLVCYAVWKNKHLRTVTNFFIVNLSASDFMVILICLPPTLLHDILETWYIGEVMCKIVAYLQSVSVLVSALTLTAIAIERYLAICHPLSHRVSKRNTIAVIAGVWATASGASIPVLIYLTVIPDPIVPDYIFLLRSCKPYDYQKEFTYQLVLVCLFFLIPFILMGFAYIRIAVCLWNSTVTGPANSSSHSSAVASQIRSRKKTAKMLIVVVIVFMACYLPVYLFNILRYVKVTQALDRDTTKAVTLISHWLCYFSSAINPIIYNFMSEKFRKEFRQVYSGLTLCCRCCNDRTRPRYVDQKRNRKKNLADGSCQRLKDSSSYSGEQTEMIRMKTTATMNF